MAEDTEFKALLAKRISSYREEEAALDRRIAEWQEQKASVAERRESAEALYSAEFGEFVETGHENVGQLALVARAGAPGPYSGMAWADATAHVLRDADAPLHIKEIWERLQAGGFRSDSRDPLRSLVATIVRRPEFVKVRPNTYSLGRPSQDGARAGAA